MIRRSDRHRPALAGSILAVLALAACAPASADSASPSITAAVVTAGLPATPSSAVAAPSTRHTSSQDQPAPAPAQTATVRPGTAVTTLATLTVKGRAPRTGYDRDLFGQAWADVDRNGCDTRNDILKRDLDGETFKPNTRDCVVLTGTLNDPYTGKKIAFTRGQGTSEAVQIDHVIALSDAWQKGAQQLSADARKSLGNDPLNLMAVDGPTNQGKGDGDAATWLPPVRSYRCTYVARQVAVKTKYRLWVTQAEHDAMNGILAGCPGQPLPTDSTLPAPK